MTSSKRGGIVVSVIGLLIGVAAFAGAFQFPIGTIAQPGPGMYSILVAALLIVGAIASIAESLFGGDNSEIEWPDRVGALRIAGVIAAAAAYAVALNYLGYLASTLIFLLAIVSLLDRSKWLRNLLFTLCFSVAAYYLFVVAFGVPLPAGVWSR